MEKEICRHCGITISLKSPSDIELCGNCLPVEVKKNMTPIEELMIAAVSKKTAPSGYDFSLQGDLQQMSAQKAFLQTWGFDVQQSDVYPVLKKEDEIPALSMLWKTRMEGWWHYKEKLIKYGICTEVEWLTGIGGHKLEEETPKESATPNSTKKAEEEMKKEKIRKLRAENPHKKYIDPDNPGEWAKFKDLKKPLRENRVSKKEEVAAPLINRKIHW